MSLLDRCRDVLDSFDPKVLERKTSLGKTCFVLGPLSVLSVDIYPALRILFCRDAPQY